MTRLARFGVWTLIGAGTLIAVLATLFVAALVHESAEAIVLMLAAGVVVSVVRRRHRVAILAAVAVAAVVVTLGTTAFSETVGSGAEMRDVGFGYPFHFVRANLHYDPPSSPRTYHWNPWEDPATFDVWRFWLSYGVIAAALLAPTWLLVRRR